MGSEYKLLTSECTLSYHEGNADGTTFEGSAANYAKHAQARIDANRVASASNKQSWKYAARAAVMGMPTAEHVAPRGHEPGPWPAWAELIHPSHYTLQAAGLVWCERCSTVATSQHTGDGCGRGAMQRILTGICRRAVSPGCPDSRKGGILIQKRRIGLTDEAPNSG